MSWGGLDCGTNTENEGTRGDGPFAAILTCDWPNGKARQKRPKLLQGHG